MNGPSISRKPIGRKPVGQSVASVPQKSSVSLASPITSTPTSSAPVAVQPASTPYQAVAPLLTLEPTPVTQPASTPATQQAQLHYLSTTSPIAVHTPAPTVTPAPVPAPAPTPAHHADQSPFPTAAVPAQAQAPITATSSPPMVTSPQGSSGLVLANSPSPPIMQTSTVATVASPVGSAQMTSTPSPTPTPGQLQRTATASSEQSLPSEYSRRTSVASSIGTSTPLSATTTLDGLQQPAGMADANIKTCASCKKPIAQNISIFTCLICSTAQVTTLVCVWCFTTGSAASSHVHAISYFPTDSDLRIQGPTGNIPAHLWTVRRNAANRLWYTHNQTGFKTHIQPLTAVVDDAVATTGIPLGWQERRTPDGKLFYFHADTNATSWVKPKNVLPPGWKMNKTPDGVPFYVNETLQLSTWDRPDEQPKPKPASTPATNAATTAGPTAARAATAAGAVAKDSRNEKAGKGSNTASKIATATYVASNVAKLSAASDLTPSGFLTATVAAAKLTGFGVKVAGKKMGKFSKKTSRNLATASNLIGAATRIAEDIEAVEEIGEAIEIQETEIALDVAEFTGDGVGPANGLLEQPLYNPSMGGTFAQMPLSLEFLPQQPLFNPTMNGTPTHMMPPLEFSPQPPLFDLSTGGMPAQMPLSPEIPLQQSPVVFNDTNVTIEEQFDELNVQSTDYTETNLCVERTDTLNVQSTGCTETNLCVESTDTMQVNQYVQQDAVITDVSWSDTLSIDSTLDSIL